MRHDVVETTFDAMSPALRALIAYDPNGALDVEVPQAALDEVRRDDAGRALGDGRRVLRDGRHRRRRAQPRHRLGRHGHGDRRPADPVAPRRRRPPSLPQAARPVVHAEEDGGARARHPHAGRRAHRRVHRRRSRGAARRVLRPAAVDHLPADLRAPGRRRTVPHLDEGPHPEERSDHPRRGRGDRPGRRPRAARALCVAASTSDAPRVRATTTCSTSSCTSSSTAMASTTTRS